MALAREQDDVGRSSPLEGRLDRRRVGRRSGAVRASRRLPASSAPRGDRVDDRLAVLAAGILVGDDHQAAVSPAIRPISGRFAVSRSPAEPNTAISPPPRAAAIGARMPRTFSSEAGECA